MIRTRDFLLYAVALIFLFIGIGSTLVKEITKDSQISATSVSFLNGQSDTEVILSIKNDDRESNLSRLRSKVEKGEGTILSAPPAFTYYSEEPTEGSLESASTNDRYMQLCANYGTDSSLISSWPINGVMVRSVEGARIVYTIDASNNEQLLLQMSVLKTRSSQDVCLKGPVVGVNLNGRLIGNENLKIYAGTNENVLIGYALDGFPIYGYKEDVSDLDQCGGMEAPGGYGYFLRPNENFVIGCFASNPATFVN